MNTKKHGLKTFNKVTAAPSNVSLINSIDEFDRKYRKQTAKTDGLYVRFCFLYFFPGRGFNHKYDYLGLSHPFVCYVY